jgi:hypothetical protein
MSVTAPALLDPLLVPFVAAPDEEAAREALGVVLDTHALPVVRTVVRRELAWGTSRGASEADLEDVVSTVTLRLTACLLRARRERAQDQDASEPIGNVRAYAGQMAANECADWMRARFPLRARLTAQVRYACRHHHELALWRWRERVWLCGLAIWRDVRDPVDASVLAALRGRLAAPLSLPAAITEAKRIVATVLTVLREANGPCRLGETVTLVADVLGIDEGMTTTARTGSAATEHETARAAAETRDNQHMARQYQFLARVWREVRELPLRQRVALLLNLRDEGQDDALVLLASAGVATHDELAACLGMSPVELTSLLPDLPQEDDGIARRLGMTRRQVINLRKCARERLARRLGFSRRAPRTGAAS